MNYKDDTLRTFDTVRDETMFSMPTESDSSLLDILHSKQLVTSAQLKNVHLSLYTQGHTPKREAKSYNKLKKLVGNQFQKKTREGQVAKGKTTCGYALHAR